MTTIFVPAPPKSAFNKDRPVSDLLRGQLRHFAYIEAKLLPEERSNMTPRDYATENGAAKYIAHLTNALRGVKQPRVHTPIRKVAAVSQGLALAAAAEKAKPASQTKAKAANKAPKRSERKA